jgi:hypothetical protein
LIVTAELFEDEWRKPSMWLNLFQSRLRVLQRIILIGMSRVGWMIAHIYNKEEGMNE